MEELDEAIKLAKKECEEMDFNNKGLSVVEMMVPYTKYFNLLGIKINQTIENGKKGKS